MYYYRYSSNHIPIHLSNWNIPLRSNNSLVFYTLNQSNAEEPINSTRPTNITNSTTATNDIITTSTNPEAHTLHHTIQYQKHIR
jgi:hypothetical protein